METSVQLCQTGAITFIGFNTFSHLTSFQTPFQVMASSGDLTLELEPVAFTPFLVLLFMDGVLLDQVCCFSTKLRCDSLIDFGLFLLSQLEFHVV